jgi:hypothetical protein
MTLSQFFALTRVELEAKRSNEAPANKPPRSQRIWGGMNDLQRLEARSNGR